MKRSVLFAIVAFGILSFSGIVFAVQNSSSIGQLSYIEGRVDRKSAGSADYIPVVKDEPVFAGDTLRTKGYSRVEISFNDKSLVKIGENSQVKLKEYALNAAGVRENARLFVDRGILRAIVSHSATGTNNFFIDTPNSMGAVKGSDICVSYMKSASTFLAISGAIETSHQLFPGKTVMVTKGMTAFVPADAPPAAVRPFLPVEQDRFEDDTAPMLAKGGKEILPADLSHAIVTAYSGDVRTRTKGTAEWHRAALKETLGEGDEIETGENGSLRLVLESGRIVEMKSNTQLAIKKFNVDPKTGHREDLLVSNKGEIRARIEKLKAGSTFQVTTPTAIAAVRGTIMYLTVSPTLTHAFFEAGQGSLTSLITGIEKLIDPGQNAQADGKGTVTDPVTTTSEQHQQLENSFNSQDQTFGYSSPDNSGTPGTPFTGDTTNTNTNMPPAGQQNQTLFDQIPPAPPSENSPSELTAVDAVDYGVWGNADRRQASLYVNVDGELSGPVAEEFGVINGIVPWTSPAGFTVVGDFFPVTEINLNDAPLLFNTPISSHTPGTGLSISPDGGALFGFTAGTWNQGIVDGSAAAIYVDPSGNTGVLTSSVQGSYDAQAGLWSAAGVFIQSPSGHTYDGDNQNLVIQDEGHPDGVIRSNDFSGNFAGSLASNNTLSGNANFTAYFIDGAPFGIYNGRINNITADIPEEGSGVWTAVIGGDGSPTEGYYDGYWIGQAAGVNSNSEIHGLLAGAFITPTQLGVFGGGVSGIYGGEQHAVAQSVGAFSGGPLEFFSTVDAGLIQVNDFGYDSYLSAYLGGAQSLWGSNAPVAAIAIGSIGYSGYEFSDHYWSTEISSYNYFTDSDTTINADGGDGGAYFGFLGGTHHANAGTAAEGSPMQAAMALIYIDSTGNKAGVVGGHFDGTSYDSIQMFQMGGFLSHEELTQDLGIAPQDLGSNLFFTGGAGNLAGAFTADNGSITADEYLLTVSILNYETSVNQPWGIYSQEITGTFDTENTNPSWTGRIGGNDSFGVYWPVESSEQMDYGFWIADLKNGTWDNNTVTASLDGKFLTSTKMGTMTGSLLGVYDMENGNWGAAGVGVYEGTPLTFSGQTEKGNFMYFSPESNASVDTGSMNGLIGSIGNVWSSTANNPANVLLMGDFDTNISNQQPLLWGMKLGSYDALNNTDKTIDGGAFAGFFGGVSVNDVSKGLAKLIYIAPSDTELHDAGILSGALHGVFLQTGAGDPGVSGLWSAEGVLTAAIKGSTSIDPSELFNFLDKSTLTASGIGSFNDLDGAINLGAIEGDAVSLQHTDWGVWGMLLGGTFNRESSAASDFTVNFTGNIYDQSSENDPVPTVWLGQLTGNRDVNGGITGNVNAVWISVNNQDTFLETGTAAGTALGNSQSAGVASTWQAISTGEFNRAVVSSSLDDIQNSLINNAVNIPITETFKSILTSASPGIASSSADFRFFNVADAINSGIWAALFNATTAPDTSLPVSIDFSGPLTDPRTNVNLGTLNATLSNISLNNNQWNAQVTGSAALAASQQLSLTGAAAGTMNDGSLTGAGAGTWKKSETV